jgi:ribosome biogenesis GTPase
LEDAIVFELTQLGFDRYFEAQLQCNNIEMTRVARVASEHREALEVWTAAGSGLARLAGRLRQEAAPASLPAVGDWVVLREALGPDQTPVIDQVLERRTVFTRGAVGREARQQVVAANVDLVFVVSGLNRDFNPRRLDRYVARVLASGAEPVLLLNKADLCPQAPQTAQEVQRRYPALEVLVLSALQGLGLEPLRQRLRPGLTIALVGSSGAGKSTLVNALLGRSAMATGACAADGRGHHVTSHRQLVLLPDGGLLLDTPGMKELQLVDEEGLEGVFGDLTALAAACRFPDCRHESEPGCAVQAALALGELDPGRLEHYRKLQREARAFEIRQDARLRHEADRAFGRMCNQITDLKRKGRG